MSEFPPVSEAALHTWIKAALRGSDRPTVVRQTPRALPLALFIFAFLGFQAYGAISGQELWRQRYGAAKREDVPRAAAVDPQGNLLVTGYSYSPTTSYDFATVKYNSAGGRKWVVRYGGKSGDFAASVAADSSGASLVAGSTIDGTPATTDYALVKYDSAGRRKWAATYNGAGKGWDAAAAVTVDATGNAFVTGHSRGTTTSYDVATIKYDPAGNRLWVKRYNGPDNRSDYGRAIAVDKLGYVYVTGHRGTRGAGTDYLTVKYNPAGRVMWVRRYNGPGGGSDSAGAIAVDSHRNVYVTGSSPGRGSGADYATIKYDSAGRVKWIARYTARIKGTDAAQDLAVDKYGNVFVTGYGFGGATLADYVTIRYDGAGTQRWIKRYNGPGSGNDIAYALDIDSSGNAYVTGASAGKSTGDDFATIKYTRAGDLVWTRRYAGPNGGDMGVAVVVDPGSGVYVTGSSYSRGTGDTYQDYLTIRYKR